MVTGSLVKCERCDGRGYERNMSWHKTCPVCCPDLADDGQNVANRAGMLPLPIHPGIVAVYPHWVTAWTHNENDDE